MASLAKSNAATRVFEGLKRIEYRGYDSWGVVGVTKNGLSLKKEVGKLSEAKKQKFDTAQVALGHTRWATHGGVTQVNAHPHLAQDASFALVQNGVVENFQELRDELLSWGYVFESETDTEIIVGLIEQELERVKGLTKSKKVSQVVASITEPNKEIITTVFKKLTGRNTIAVLTKSGNIFAVRSGSPLVVGKNKAGEVFFSSDVVSLSNDVEEYMVIKSGEVVSFINSELNISKITDGRAVKISFTKMDFSQLEIDKAGFKTFMMKEIHDQSKNLHSVTQGKEAEYRKAVRLIKDSKKVYTLGAGTAHFAAQHVAMLLRKTGRSATAVASYEADSYRGLFDDHSVAIVFSQSGETADTNEVVEYMKSQGTKIISVVNMPGSTLTQLSDLPFMLDVGAELAVASTKAFFGHMLWGISIYDLFCKEKYNDIDAKIFKFEQYLSEWLDATHIQTKIKKLAANLAKKDHAFILGRGDLYTASLESALKLKEISYIHAEGFSGGELKHGVIALIEKGTPVLCLVAEDENKANMLNAIAEVNARGGYTIVVAQEDNELYKEWIEVPQVAETLFPLFSIVPAQLLTCYIAEHNGFDVDKPRNLAKSVTVK